MEEIAPVGITIAIAMAAAAHAGEMPHRTFEWQATSGHQRLVQELR